jgi:hypothetical protein
LRIRTAFASTKRLYIEAAPLIYYVEENEVYINRMDAIIEHVENMTVEILTSVITLTEVLTHPLRFGHIDLYRNTATFCCTAIIFASSL